MSIQGLAKLQVGIDGKLYAEDIDMDLTFRTIDMDFTNLDGIAYLFQSFVNSLGSFLFDSIKPFILKEVNTSVK